MKKRLMQTTGILLVLILILSVCGCDAGKPEQPVNTTSSQTATPPLPEEDTVTLAVKDGMFIVTHPGGAQDKYPVNSKVELLRTYEDAALPPIDTLYPLTAERGVETFLKTFFSDVKRANLTDGMPPNIRYWYDVWGIQHEVPNRVIIHFVDHDFSMHFIQDDLMLVYGDGRNYRTDNGCFQYEAVLETLQN